MSTPITEIYVMFSEIRGITDTMHIKIGISNNVNDRLKGVQTGNPGTVHLIQSFPAGRDAQKHELHLHKKYKQYSTGGEWFEFNSEEFESQILPEIIDYCNQIEVIEGDTVTTSLSLSEITSQINYVLKDNDYVSRKSAIIYLEKVKILVDDAEKVKYQKVIDELKSAINQERDQGRIIAQNKLAVKVMKRKKYEATKRLETFALNVLASL